jgi:hypothetical protein
LETLFPAGAAGLPVPRLLVAGHTGKVAAEHVLKSGVVQ